MNRNIRYEDIVGAVRDLCIRGTTQLPDDVYSALTKAAGDEQSPAARSILLACIGNADTASREQVPICQDTGFAVFFVALGNDVRIDGGLIGDAITEGTAQGYREGYLRASMVKDPLFERVNTRDNTPPVIHLTIVPGSGLEIIFAPKGGGSENMSQSAMLNPSDGEAGVRAFVSKTVIEAGANPCPPVIVGVGIGGTFEYCAFLSKKALLRKTGEPHADPRYAELERAILEEINLSGVGSQGLGGTVTALSVHIETFSCHIASLPVAVNLNCHAARHVSVCL